MKSKLIIIAILFLLSSTIFSQNKRDKEWIEDIDYIVTRIEITHPNIYANISQKKFKEYTKQLKQNIPKLTDPEVVLGMWELLAQLDDGHTDFRFFESNTDLMNKYFKSFPFTIYPFSDGYYIIAATKKYKGSVGKKVVKIGNMSINEAVKRVSKIIKADNKYGMLGMLPFILNIAEILKYYDINTSLSELDLELENEKGEKEIVSFESKPIMKTFEDLFRGFIPTASDNKMVVMNKNSSNPTPLWFQNTNENYWFKYLKEKHTYYLQINKNSHKKDENFTVFINRMFKEFDENKAEKLIIDIRLNDGGQHIELPLLKGILARPNLDKPENLFLLTSRIVFSAAQHLTSRLSFNTNITLVGEPTGSKPNFFGSPKTFSPPNNKDLVFRSSSAFFQDVIPQDYRLTTKPDFFAPLSSIHYKNNIDPAIEMVFSIEKHYQKYNQLATEYIEKLKKAYKKSEMKGLISEYQNLKHEILKNRINYEDIFLTDFDMWMTENRKSAEKYIEYLEFLDQEFPNDYLLKYWLASWQKSRNPEKAKDYYKQCLEINPMHIGAKREYKLMLLNESIKNKKEKQIDFFENSNIDFDFSSIDKIYFSTEEILADIDAFWETDTAYIRTKSWHENTGVKIPHKKWKKEIRKISKMAIDKKKSSQAITMANKLKTAESEFMKIAIPHIASFLPNSTPEVKGKIYFTDKIVPWAFAISGDNVLCISDIHYQNNDKFILNILVHEIFHLGYSHFIPIRTEKKLDNKTHHGMIASMHNEGLANYTAYLVQETYPTIEQDYEMLDDFNIVKNKIKDVNKLFEEATIKKAEEIFNLSWDIGIMQRAYYVVGSYMAKTIDEKLGREVLVGTIEKGPRSFVSIYNSLVTDELKIYEFNEN